MIHFHSFIDWSFLFNWANITPLSTLCEYPNNTVRHFVIANNVPYHILVVMLPQYTSMFIVHYPQNSLNCATVNLIEKKIRWFKSMSYFCYLIQMRRTQISRQIKICYYNAILKFRRRACNENDIENRYSAAQRAFDIIIFELNIN